MISLIWHARTHTSTLALLALALHNIIIFSYTNIFIYIIENNDILMTPEPCSRITDPVERETFETDRRPTRCVWTGMPVVGGGAHMGAHNKDNGTYYLCAVWHLL